MPFGPGYFGFDGCFCLLVMGSFGFLSLVSARGEIGSLVVVSPTARGLRKGFLATVSLADGAWVGGIASAPVLSQNAREARALDAQRVV